MIYAGEEVKVSVAAKDFDHATTIEASEVQSMVVTGYDSTGIQIFQAPMVWDDPNKMWFYMWDTSGLDAGTYRLRLLMTDLMGGESWEYKRVRLARNPV